MPAEINTPANLHGHASLSPYDLCATPATLILDTANGVSRMVLSPQALQVDVSSGSAEIQAKLHPDAAWVTLETVISNVLRTYHPPHNFLRVVPISGAQVKAYAVTQKQYVIA